MRRVLLSLLFSLVFAGVSHGAIDTYEFADEAQRERFAVLVAELRCPKCQNQNLADSNAPIATDLRREIHRMLGEGQTDEQIVEFLVLRYGEFVRYKPALNERTWVLWFGPAALLLAGLIGLALIVRRRRSTATHSALAGLTADEQSRLRTLLNKDPQDTQN